MKRILAAVDGSDQSLKAVDFAADLAAKYGADLGLIAVVAEVSIGDPGLAEYARAEHLRAPGAQLPLAAADNILRRARDRAAVAGAARISVEAAVGDPATQIVAATKDRGTDLVVVGSRGHGRLVGLLLGSVAQKVLSLAPCPVVVVR
ncbi:MAG: universal stress protein [Proteobacteria bacterium]|nr:universal stress protein [Pseudomonadota bacterium]